jgi:aspartate/methionine/tyrosine aminotransferase
MLNPRLEALTDYTFRRLAVLLESVAPAPGRSPVDLSIGQPMHPVPALLTDTLHAHDHLWGRYPPVNGTPEFRAAAADWLTGRYHLPLGLLDPERHVLPVAGTKEALFLIAQVVVPAQKAGHTPAVLLPNPFYNVYLGGAVLAGAEPVLLPVSAATGHLPALDQLSPGLLERGMRESADQLVARIRATTERSLFRDA